MNEIEGFVGIDFFPALPDVIEEILESTLDLQLWDLEQVELEGAIPEYRTEAKQIQQPDPEAVLYWINSNSNVRHNPSCRYYGNTKTGYYSADPIGKACEICGG